MYIGYMQFLLIMFVFVFIKSLGANSFTEFVFSNTFISVSIILLALLFFSLVLGYLNSRLGFREEEIRNYSKSNPVLSEI